jgi:hypothetical protein
MEGAYLPAEERWMVGAQWTVQMADEDDGNSNYEATFGEVDLTAAYGFTKYLEFRFSLGIGGLDSSTDDVDPQEDGSPLLLDSDTGTSISDFVVGAKWLAWKSEKGAFAVTTDIKIPAGGEDDFVSTGQTDFSIGGIYSRRIGRLEGHINLGFQILGDADEALDTDFELDNIMYYGIALAQPLDHCWSLIYQIQGNSSAWADLDGLDDAPLEGIFGVRYANPDGWGAHAGLGLGLSDGSAGTSFDAGVTYRF